MHLGVSLPLVHRELWFNHTHVNKKHLLLGYGGNLGPPYLFYLI